MAVIAGVASVAFGVLVIYFVMRLIWPRLPLWASPFHRRLIEYFGNPKYIV